MALLFLTVQDLGIHNKSQKLFRRGLYPIACLNEMFVKKRLQLALLVVKFLLSDRKVLCNIKRKVEKYVVSHLSRLSDQLTCIASSYRYWSEIILLRKVPRGLFTEICTSSYNSTMEQRCEQTRSWRANEVMYKIIYGLGGW